MTRLLHFFLVCVLCTASLHAQEHRHHIGVAASTISGAGISYQYIFSPALRMKISGIAHESSGWWGIIGAEAQWTLHQTEGARLYGLLGAGFHYSDFRHSFYSRTNEDFLFLSSTDSGLDRTYFGGIGIGIELMLWEHLALNFDGGIAHRHQSELYELYSYEADGTVRFHGKAIDGIRRTTSIGGGVGVSYAF